MDFCSLCGSCHLLRRCARLAIGNIFIDCPLKEPCVLQHHCVSPPQACTRNITDGMMIHRNLPCVHIIKPHQKIDQRRLSGASRSYHRHQFSRRSMQIQMLDDTLFFCVSKAYIFQQYISFYGFQRQRVFSVRCLCRLIHHMKYALCGSQCRL